MMHPPPVVLAYPFAVFVVSALTTKLVHLWLHASAAPFFALLFYLPTIFLPDLLVLCAVRLLLRRERSLLVLGGYLLGCLLTIITLCAAASQLGFFYETGGEIDWRDAGSFAGSEEGRQVLLSGTTSVVTSGVILLVIAWFSRNALYKAAGNLVTAAGQFAATAFARIWRFRRGPEPPRQDVEMRAVEYGDLDSDSDNASDYGSDTDSEDGSFEYDGFLGETGELLARPAKLYSRAVPAWVTGALLLSWLAFASLVRPTAPYHHMSATLPFTLFAVFRPPPDYCAEQATVTGNEWPLPDLLNDTMWEKPSGNFKGWAPGRENDWAAAYRQRSPDWLPQPAPDGFPRWDPERLAGGSVGRLGGQDSKGGAGKQGCGGDKLNDTFYNPVNDPLKITNLDADILEPIKKTLDDGSVKIKHVVLVLMESLREELFPIQNGSDIYNMILDSHDADEQEGVGQHLARLTPNIERITGRPGGFDDADRSTAETADLDWIDRMEPGFGGINVVGGFTPSSVSTKSIAASHCGVWPMPVEMFEEAETDSYQPCLPQILEMFNQRGKDKKSDDFREHDWYPAFFQSVTDTYDRQKEFDNKIGFKQTIARNQIGKKINSGQIEEAKAINYFGYPENVLTPIIRGFVRERAAAKERMFLTHFTSTTHHPWKTPEDFNRTSYMSGGGAGKHKDFDKYLNTIRFHDTWLGEMMQLFDELEIANETLVVFAGDHGQAFKEDNGKQGTYENGHVSNFRIPITFRHPRLPSLQYEANATSLSILPTILDLLASTGSLSEGDAAAAADLVQDYEGQSLIRPYVAEKGGRRAWNFGIVNAGGGMLTVTSADAPWRLVMPLDKEMAWSFTDLAGDPLELEPVSKWSKTGLVGAVRKQFGDGAAAWVGEAQVVAEWWGTERKRLWRYHSGSKKDKKNKKGGRGKGS